MQRAVSKLICGFHYEYLDIDGQFLYRRIGMAVSRCEDSVSADALDTGLLRKVLMAIRYDNPEFLYWDPSGSAYDGREIRLRYRGKNPAQISEILEKLRRQRKDIVRECSSEAGQSQIEILRGVYDYMTGNIEYAWAELQKPRCFPWIYDIEGALLRNRAACPGIAQAFNYICLSLHIPSAVVTGEAEINGQKQLHMWDLVQVDGCYMYVDVTRGIIDKDEGKYRYFLVE